MNGVQAERDRMNRALFECLLWENAALIASASAAERKQGLSVVMAAYDAAVRTRRRRPRRDDIRAQAEAELTRANGANGYSDAETAARRDALVAAALGLPEEAPGERTQVA